MIRRCLLLIRRVPQGTASLAVAAFLLILVLGDRVAADRNLADLIFQAADHHYKGDLGRAISMFETAASLDSNDEFVGNQLGILYAKEERFTEAFDQFARVAAIDSRNTTAFKWIGILHLRQGDLNAAFNAFSRIIKVDPENADAYYYLGAIYSFRRNPPMAIEYLKKSRDADAEEADTHFRLGKAFHNIDMTANALLEYHRVLDLNPGYTKAINEIGWVYYNKGDVDAAIKQWQRTLQVNRSDRDAIDNLAKAYNDLAWLAYESGRIAEARAFWEKTVSIRPRDKAARYYLKRVPDQ